MLQSWLMATKAASKPCSAVNVPWKYIHLQSASVLVGLRCDQGLLIQVLKLMELETLRNSVVGLPGVNGLSVEQRKRLTIGVELVANPGSSGIPFVALLGDA